MSWDGFDIEDALQLAWCGETSSDPAGWTPDNPARGQCAVTALIVQDVLGGELLRAVHRTGISHYWNQLPDGSEVDFTRQQFGEDQSFGPTETRTRAYVLSHKPTLARMVELWKRL